MADATIQWYDGPLRQLLASQHGPVGIYVAGLASKVVDRAKMNASGRPGPNVQTGRLRGSISYELGTDSHGVYADVGTNVYYGAILELYTFPNGGHYPWLVPALDAIRGG